jgi:agmatinase
LAKRAKGRPAAEPVAQFGDLPEEYCDPTRAAVAVIPVPYDGTSTWQKGADRGPDAIVAASAQVELYDIETDSEAYRVGIHTQQPVAEARSPELMTAAVRERVAGVLSESRFPVVLGGEHSVSLGAVQACRERHPDLSVLQLDAHTDLRAEYHGSPYNHACVMARVQELCPIVQVGIRSMDREEAPSLDRRRVFFAEGIASAALSARRLAGIRSPLARRSWMREAVRLLGPRVYVTVDLDVFDPSVLPATGTPEPGGLEWYDVTAFLRLVAEAREIVGFDVVELCPGGNPASDFLAAKLVYKLLSYRCRAAITRT